MRDLALYEEDADENLTNLFGRATAASFIGRKNDFPTRQYIETRKKLNVR